MSSHLTLIEENCRLCRDLLACQEDRDQLARLSEIQRQELARAWRVLRDMGVVNVGAEMGRLLPKGDGASQVQEGADATTRRESGSLPDQKPSIWEQACRAEGLI